MMAESTESKFASLAEILKNIEEKVVNLERNDKEIMQKIDDLKGGKIAAMETQVAILHERVGIMQKIIYGLVGAVLLAVAGSVINLVIK